MNLLSILLLLILLYVAWRMFSGLIKTLITVALLLILIVTPTWVGIDNVERFPQRIEFGNEHSLNLETPKEALLSLRVGRDQLLEAAREAGWWLPKDFTLTPPAGPFFKPAPIIVEGAEGEYALPPSPPTPTGIPPSNLPSTPTLAPAEKPPILPTPEPSSIKKPEGNPSLA